MSQLNLPEASWSLSLSSSPRSPKQISWASPSILCSPLPPLSTFFSPLSKKQLTNLRIPKGKPNPARCQEERNIEHISADVYHHWKFSNPSRMTHLYLRMFKNSDKSLKGGWCSRRGHRMRWKYLKFFVLFWFGFFFFEEEEEKSLLTGQWKPCGLMLLLAASFFSIFLTYQFSKSSLFFHVKALTTGTAAAVRRIRLGAHTGDTTAGWEKRRRLSSAWATEDSGVAFILPGDQSLSIRVPTHHT